MVPPETKPEDIVGFVAGWEGDERRMSKGLLPWWCLD